ncbi:MAG TPA: hypothetical protein VKE69_11765 [Planctomycetota bacterium]|nr:hypothetical protein [Planctomycetota bacterium]
MPLSRSRLEQVRVPDELPGFKIRRYRPGDESGILRGFERVFAPGNPAFTPKSIAHWRWQFSENPDGMQVYVAIDDASGEVAGHFACVPRRAKCGDRLGVATEGVDSYVDSRFRGGLRRPGLFVVLAVRFFRDYADGGNLFDYGLPVSAAWRMGNAFLRYRVVSHLLALERSVAEPRALGGPASPTVSEVSDFDVRFDDLWTRVAPELEIACVRDAKALRWRYVLHPAHRYRIGVVGDAKTLRGYAIFRRGHFDDRDHGLLVDLLVPRADIDAAHALTRWAAERAREEGASALTAVVPPPSPWFLELQRRGFLVRGTKYDWVVGWERRPYDAPALRRAWWCTLGDTDLA